MRSLALSIGFLGMIRNARCHRKGLAQALMGAGEIVVHEVEGDGSVCLALLILGLGLSISITPTCAAW